MKKITQTILLIVLICLGTVNSSAQIQNPEGGQQFTVDGFSYEATNFNPNEAELIGGTAEGSLVIASTVTFQDVMYSVTEIGFSAFSGNVSLTSVTIPATVVDINDNAFANTGLTEVIALGTTAAVIGGNSFGVRSGINLTVPFGAEETYLNNGWEGFATINGTAGTFEANNITYGINSATLNTVTVLDTSLTGNVTIPTTVTSNSTVYTITKIGESAFENKQLTSITMPNTVTDIGNAAFRDNQLGSATLSNTLETIGQDAFRNNQLTSVTLANTLTTLGDRAFQNNQIASIDIPGSVMILGNSVFRENDLATINLAEGITTIEASAFKDNNLTNITIPASVTSIEFFGFNDNPLTNLTSLATIPPVIGNPNFIFGTNNSLGNIDLIVPDGTEAAYQAANWVGFNSVNGAVPNEIGNTFEFNGLLYTITALAPNEVNIVGGNTIPATLVIPAVASNGGTDFSVTEIGNNAFFNTGITSVSIPNSVITIGSLAFEDNLLTNLVIPDGVQTIGNRAFRVNQIQAVSIPNSVTSLGGQAFQGNQLSSLVLSDNITEIGQGTFDVNNLTSVTLPDGIVTIGSRAFRENDITDLILPSSVVTIVDEAFVENPLATITANGTTPATIGTNSFGSRLTIDLTVPTGTETTYETAGWTGFASVNGVIQLNIGNTFTENNFNYTIIGLSPNSVEITGGTSIPQDLIIDATVTTEGTDFSVVRVGASAFENKGLTSVQLPNTIRIINSTAFQSNQITSLSIPDGVTSIGTRAFRLNQIGGSVVIPNSVTSLGNGVFELNNISAVTISENLSAIGNQTFRENQLTTVTIPANINSLGSNCFRSNPLLTEVIVLNTTPPALNGNDPFQNLRGNIALTVPTTTELDYLTNGWTGFATINGQDPAFFNEFEVDNIIYRIKTLNPNEVEVDDSTASGEVVIPDVVTDNGQDYTVSSITGGAFIDNQLTTVTISASVTNIGARAFRNAPLTTVIVEGVTPPAINSQANTSNTFTNRANIELFIPTGTLQAYTDASWTGFSSVTEASKALKLKVYLQGASLSPNTGEESLMRDDLRVADVIPTTSPYGDGAIANASVFTITGADAIVDWIFVELRDKTNNTNIIESASALLQRDGDVVSSDGVSLYAFTAAVDDYFISIKHRNHLGIMITNAKKLSATATVIDFTDAANQITFGSNAQTDGGMPANIVGMWSGNVNGDNIVQYLGGTPDTTAILSATLNDPGNFLNFSTFIINGYNDNDVNMSGTTQYEGGSADSPLILQNVLAHPGNFLNFSTFQIQEQLPEN